MDDDKDGPPDLSRGNPMIEAAAAYFGNRGFGPELILSYVASLVRIRSAVDFGAGRGFWLNVLRQFGAHDILGFEAPGASAAHIVIPPECFRTADLGQPLDIGRRFDIALSTEVAEHVRVEDAPQFVANMAATSDLVLFSAGIPYQAGIGHQNEIWPEYWAKRFAMHGFGCYDILRERFWNNGIIPSYYRQNLLLFARAGMAEALEAKGHRPTQGPLSLVHPEQYLKVIGRALPPELERIGPDVTQYYDAVTRSPDTIDADARRILYGKDPVGWAAIVAFFGE